MTRPVAVFDSGLGGLSVVRHLRRELPHEDVVYFGDTARVPYGTKSRRTVVNFSLEAARFLLRFDPKIVVAACNTASALALDALVKSVPVPVIGVVEPGAQAAVRLAPDGPIAVIGTEATVASDTYRSAIHVLAPRAVVISQPCPLFVPMVEEGRSCDDAIVQAVAEEYLQPIRGAGAKVVVLGCTHYPLLREAIARVVGPQVAIVDSGRETSRAVREALAAQAALSPPGAAGSMTCYVSDNPTRFRAIGSRFLDEKLEHAQFVGPEEYISTSVLEGGTP